MSDTTYHAYGFRSLKGNCHAPSHRSEVIRGIRLASGQVKSPIDPKMKGLPNTILRSNGKLSSDIQNGRVIEMKQNDLPAQFPEYP